MMRLALVALTLLAALPAVAQQRPPLEARLRAEAATYLTPCAQPAGRARNWCEAQAGEFVRDYLRAHAGEYQGQRNVAYSLNGRDPTMPVRSNLVQGCAWRLVVIRSGHPQLVADDTAALRRECGEQSAIDREASIARAAHLIAALTNAPLPNPPSRDMHSAQRHAGPFNGQARPLTASTP